MINEGVDTRVAHKRGRLRFEWVDRLARTFGDPKLRYWMLREGFKRLERIRTREMTLNVGGKTIDTTIGELFRRDLSQALLLDWHINSPVYVWDKGSAWKRDVGTRIEGFQQVARSGDLTRMRRDQELQLVAELLQARMGNMTDPAERAGKILKYAGPDLVADIAKSVGYNSSSYDTRNDLIEDFLQRRMNAQAVEAWWNFTPDQTVLSFKKYDDTTQGN